jgi:NADH-quinone oxidoreductase subunit C
MDDFGSVALRRLLDAHGDAVTATHAQHGDATAVVERARLLDALHFLRDDPECAFQMLADLCAVDHLEQDGDPRFEVVYHLYSLEKNHRLRVKVGVPEDDCTAPSAIPVWPGANWLEREVWDLYGIRFDGHPDLRRLLLYEEFEGHPLRKDYAKERRQPLIGPEN